MTGHACGGGALSTLTRAVLSLRPLIDALPQPIRVTQTCGDDPIAVRHLLSRVSQRLGTPPFTVVPASDQVALGLFERVVSDGLGLDRLAGEPQHKMATMASDVDLEIDAVAAHHAASWRQVGVAAFDGTVLHAYTTPADRDETVVVVPACGMPVALCGAWLWALGSRYRVITYETRGVFGASGGVDAMRCDVDTQASDIMAVMDHFGIERAHVMAFCGAGVLTLLAAAAWPFRVRSMTLWHGDYEFGRPLPRTQYQQDLRTLLEMAAQSPAEAAAVRDLFCQATAARGIDRTIRRDVAHLVLYPYANDDVFFRYAIVNDAIMRADVSGVLDRIACPVLVVTSRDDHTIHPSGSQHLARVLPTATLHVEPSGDHLTAFDASPHLVDLVEKFWTTLCEPRIDPVRATHV